MNGSLRPLYLAMALVLMALLALLAIGAWRALGAPRQPTAPQPSTSPSHATDIRPLAQPILAIPVLPAESPTVTPSPTLTPTPASTPTPISTPTASPTALPSTLALAGIRHMWQTWNNCGPATLAMNLSYYGSLLDQAAVGASLRQHPDDKNVGPEELAQYAREQGFQAQVRVGGDADLLRTLLNNGLPVILETWHPGEDGSLRNGLGHYRLLAGYDDAAQAWIAYDSYDAANLVNPEGPYAGIRLPYAETDTLWSVFNRTYVLLYPPEQAPQVDALLGDAGDAAAMWQRALADARATTVSRPDDPFAWFNLGSSAAALGDYATAAAAFDRARALGLPWRMLWYQFGPFEAYLQVGRYDEVVALANATLATTDSIEELHYWRGMALANLGRVDAAQAAWRQAQELNPTFTPAADALAQHSSQ